MKAWIEWARKQFAGAWSQNWFARYRTLAFIPRFLINAMVLLAIWKGFEAVTDVRLVPIDVFSVGDEVDRALVQAAWFQAIGSVAAIASAIWIANRQVREAEARADRDRRARALIEGGSLISLFQGVAIEARTKGAWMLDHAYHRDYMSLLRTVKEDAERFRFASIELLRPHFGGVTWFQPVTGMNLGIALSFLMPYNATLRDAVSRPVASEEEARQLFFTLAKRAVTAQQVAHEALRILKSHPACSEELLRHAGDLSWYDVGDIDLSSSPIESSLLDDFL